jgi:hypothetical protein
MNATAFALARKNHMPIIYFRSANRGEGSRLARERLCNRRQDLTQPVFAPDLKTANLCKAGEAADGS